MVFFLPCENRYLISQHRTRIRRVRVLLASHTVGWAPNEPVPIDRRTRSYFE
ncbi:hypothetical protein MLP_11680 [Microlunatus phosphovorus NM-1]|uniref:Uncharacterized protein n=1 Tax=Microlunatus phosphovorus (strain ATCC 700054 / DSM 10555 / JCM 9379 / NBRC 101784 / NCIMB 13414 / VKM Ac-1990 / NM-1) TaxID=1032480 RepID=F5XNR8_MICPN|nr:hypothetical protein MLP_11680 [Microlunatus phosphovorus NM-1]